MKKLELMVTYFNALLQHLPGETEENHEYSQLRQPVNLVIFNPVNLLNISLDLVRCH
jgi:hypothetical protein